MKKKKQNKNLYIILSIVLGAIAIAGIVVGVLALNGVFNCEECEEFDEGSDEISCPIGTRRYCSYLAGGEKVCECVEGGDVMAKKPIIYLYPEKETEVFVKLGAPERLTVTYPKYTDSWDVLASPNGDLIDKLTGKKLYALYWEGINNDLNLDYNTGFIVKGEESATFLEEKLELLGLNYKEAEEFIIYWLPQLEANNYNYVYFETAEEIDAEMPIIVSPQPNTIIRVRMAFKALKEPIEINKQTLTPAPERKGFTLVEWGATEL